MSGWKHVADGLPLGGPTDQKFDGEWRHVECEIMDDKGNISKAWFSSYLSFDSSKRIERVSKKFRTDANVIYWRLAE